MARVLHIAAPTRRHEMDSYGDPRQTSRMMKATSLGLLALALLFATTPVHAAGEPEVRTTQIAEAGSNISWGHAVGVIDQPIEQVLPVVVDYANYAHFMPNFTKSKVLAQRGNRAMVYMEVSVASGTFTLWGQLKLSEAPSEGTTRVVEASLLEGNMDAFSATWRLTPVDGGAGTEVDFKIFVDPDMPLPSSVFSRENERAAGKTVRALRTRVADTAQRS
jgi:ribosome-associated toxin RatA of RatAB toxin-antitoxin module